jgi:hypothetical protein
MNSNYPFYYGYATCNVSTGQSFQSEQHVKIFPNPGNGSVSIQLDMEIKEITLVNSTGQEKIFITRSTLNRIDLAGISPGIYIIKVKDATNAIHLSRFINY